MTNTSISVKPSGRGCAVTILMVNMPKDLTSALCYSSGAAFSLDLSTSVAQGFLKEQLTCKHMLLLYKSFGVFTPTTTIPAGMLLMMGLASTRTPPSTANRISDTSKMRAFIAITTSSL